MLLVAFLILLVVGGLVIAAWGVVTALQAPRPRSLGGALVAAVGLALALAGGARILVPGFF